MDAVREDTAVAEVIIVSDEGAEEMKNPLWRPLTEEAERVR